MIGFTSGSLVRHGCQMNIQKFMGFAAVLLVAISMFVLTDAYDHQRWTKAFQPGVRFGRSGGAGGGAKKISAMRTMVAPRNERFEMGSRYGKRSQMGEIAETLVFPVADSTHKSFACGKNEEFTCTHTGVTNIYRCNQSFNEEQQAEIKK